MTRKANRSKYGDPKIGRAVSTLFMSVTSASQAAYYVTHLGGSIDSTQLSALLGHVRRTLRHLEEMQAHNEKGKA